LDAAGALVGAAGRYTVVEKLFAADMKPILVVPRLGCPASHQLF